MIDKEAMMEALDVVLNELDLKLSGMEDGKERDNFLKAVQLIEDIVLKQIGQE